jgi:hypothetical protein
MSEEAIPNVSDEPILLDPYPTTEALLVGFMIAERTGDSAMAYLMERQLLYRLAELEAQVTALWSHEHHRVCGPGEPIFVRNDDGTYQPEPFAWQPYPHRGECKFPPPMAIWPRFQHLPAPKEEE